MIYVEDIFNNIMECYTFLTQIHLCTKCTSHTTWYESFNARIDTPIEFLGLKHNISFISYDFINFKLANCTISHNGK